MKASSEKPLSRNSSRARRERRTGPPPARLSAAPPPGRRAAAGGGQRIVDILVLGVEGPRHQPGGDRHRMHEDRVDDQPVAHRPDQLAGMPAERLVGAARHHQRTAIGTRHGDRRGQQLAAGMSSTPVLLPVRASSHDRRSAGSHSMPAMEQQSAPPSRPRADRWRGYHARSRCRSAADKSSARKACRQQDALVIEEAVEIVEVELRRAPLLEQLLGKARNTTSANSAQSP